LSLVCLTHTYNVSVDATVWITENVSLNKLLKVKQSRYTPWGCLGGEVILLLLIHDHGTRGEGEWSASRPGPRFNPGERTPGTHCKGGWVGPRAGLDTEARGKMLSPLPGIEPRSPGRPARSQTLYRLSYPGSQMNYYYHKYNVSWLDSIPVFKWLNGHCTEAIFNNLFLILRTAVSTAPEPQPIVWTGQAAGQLPGASTCKGR
jgi:hypothetical protein